jgi:hypothetical protein
MANKTNLEELVNEISIKTNAELIPWEEGAAEDEFVAPMGGTYLLKVVKHTIAHQSFSALRITDAEGNLIIGTTSIAYEQIHDVYEAARNQAKGIDKAILAVMEDLKRLK